MAVVHLVRRAHIQMGKLSDIRNAPGTTTVYFFSNVGVVFKDATEGVVMDQNFERVAKLMVIAMVTALPNGIVRRFAELIDADYEKMLKVGMYDNRIRAKRNKLTEKQAGSIKLLKGIANPRKLAADHNVSYGAIMHIWSGKTWKKLPFAKETA